MLPESTRCGLRARLLGSRQPPWAPSGARGPHLSGSRLIRLSLPVSAGGGSSIPLFCFSRADNADPRVAPGASTVSDVVVAAPVPALPKAAQQQPLQDPLGSKPAADPLSFDDPDLSPALLAMLNDIAPRSVLEMCLTDEGPDDCLHPPALKASVPVPGAAPMPPARRATPGPVWATTMPPPFPGPAPVPFQHGQAQLPAFWFGQQQPQQSTWMPNMPAPVLPMQTQSFWSF